MTHPTHSVAGIIQFNSKGKKMQPYAAQWLSIVPPMVAIGLSLITKEVFSSLFVGILTGTLIYACGTGANVVMGTVETAFKLMCDKLDFNIIIFCSLFGALVYLINLSGGTLAYGRAAARGIKSRRASLMATSGLGVMLFIDDYFNCLTVGTVMRPLTDLYKVSREKLAYIVDATAAPICIIAPISSWAAAVGSHLKGTGVFDNEMSALIATIPWNFYALLSLLMVWILSCSNCDFGLMRKAEIRTAQNGMVKSQGEDEASAAGNPNGTPMDMIVPLVSLVVFAVLALMYSGGYWGKDALYKGSFIAALGNCSAAPALVWASFGAIFVAFVMYVPRRLVSFRDFMGGIVEGIKLMLPANMILVLAWTLSGVCRDLLSTPQFVQSVVTSSGMSALFLPFFIFIIAAFLSFSTGTAWGTFGILIPIVVPLVHALDPGLTVVALSATLAGSVFGDHCSPISDTTILSSAGAGCEHMAHVSTQLPYALMVAMCAAFGYLVAGVTGGSLPLSLLAAAGSLVVGLVALHARSAKREPAEGL